MRINLGSTKLAFILIGLLLSLIVLSAIIPQEDITQNQMIDVKEKLGVSYKIIESLKLDRIYTSPYFFILLGLLAVNIVFGNLKRFRIIYKTEKTLIKARHIGSIIFHFSLVMLMAGVILNYLYRFDGAIALIEGQSIIDQEKVYSKIYRGPLNNDLYNRFLVKHIKFYTDYDVNETTTVASEIAIKEATYAKEVKGVVYTNHPLMFYELEIHYGQQFGFAPELVFMNKNDSVIFRSFVRLAVTRHPDKNMHFDYYIIPSTGHKISIEIVPVEKPNDSIKYNVLVEKNDKTLYEGSINGNDTASFSDFKITIPELRNWCYINVVKSPFLWIVFFSFWLALAGMTVGFIPRVIGEKKRKHELN